MAKRIDSQTIAQIKELRSKGWSLPEIHKKVGIGYGSVFRLIKDVSISPEYLKTWFGKRGGSIKRKQRLESEAKEKANNKLEYLTKNEKLLFISALYWAEGGKIDFNFTNSDPEMIKIFVWGLENIFEIERDNIKISIRIYEDINRKEALEFWSKVTNIPVSKFVSVNVLKGKKQGKLIFGLCRVRINKGGNMLKYLLALNKRVSELFFESPRSSTDKRSLSVNLRAASPRSSTDRTEVS